MLSLLIENNVDFLLIGAYALAVHGFPRATGDIDIFVKAESKNAAKVYNALANFGAPMEKIAIQDFSIPGTIVQIGVIPRRIDIITTIDGLSYDEASEGKEMVKIDDLLVPVISKQKLIINKLASGREKDRLDAENLKKI
ncbi:MAG: hypothetical protein PHC61_08765 [Chitinivibrionales bacterium]|nr:hypothetical protein [Chitinivibrionales bacterium]